MRDLKLFCILDDDQQREIEVTAIHNDAGYQKVREELAGQYNLGNREPNIQVQKVNVRGDRSLTLQHVQHNRKPLGKSTLEVLKHVHRLWGFDVHLHSVQNDEVTASYHCPEPSQATPGDLELALPVVG